MEQGRCNPYDEEKNAKLIRFLRLTEEDVATMYDLAARENSMISWALNDIMMYTEAGEMARFALLMTKKGVINENDWNRFIYYIKVKKTDNKKNNDYS